MNQVELEEYFSKTKARDFVLDLLLEDKDGMELIGQGTELLEAWCVLPSKYETKQQRRDTLAKMEVHKIVQRVFVDVLMMPKPASLANVATALGISLGFEEAKQGITLAGEILAVLSHTGFFGLSRKDKNATYYIYPHAMLTDEEWEIATRGMYMPPLIEKPKMLKHNRSTPYHTIKDESLILGGHHNHHDYYICQDVLNKQNNIPLCLNEDFINNILEEATYDLDAVKGMDTMPVMMAREMLHNQRRNWEIHIEQSVMVYETVYNEGNRFYIPNKVDKRGRIYAQGHHINPMGSDYKKASVDLCDKEIINIPKGYFK